MRRGRPIRRRGAGVVLLCLGMGALLAGCGKHETLRAFDRVPLRDSVASQATLAVDSAGLAWIGQPGWLTAVDTAGVPRAQLRVSLTGIPRLLGWRGSRALLRTGAAVAVLDSARGDSGSVRRSEAPLIFDPRGHWLFTATRNGSVLGLDPATLAPRWGWPDAGSRVLALAASPLGDRVYVALAGSDRHQVPPSIEVRDAFNGQLLSSYQTSAVVSVLEVAPNGMLFAAMGGQVTALRHGRDGLGPVWSHGFGGLGGPTPDAIRVSPSGARVAVLARGRELRLLRAADGQLLEQSTQAPRDAAWDAAGRLWVLGSREIRIVR